MRVNFSKAAKQGKLVSHAAAIGGASAVTLDGQSITIHPNAKEPARVIVSLDAPSNYIHLGSSVTNPNSDAHPVRFAVYVRDSAGSVLASATASVNGGQSATMLCFTALSNDKLSIELVTEMANATHPSDRAWARFDWVDPETVSPVNITELTYPQFEDIPIEAASNLCSRWSEWCVEFGLGSGRTLVSDGTTYSLVPMACANPAGFVGSARKNYLYYHSHPIRKVPAIYLYAFENAIHFPHGVLYVEGKIVAETHHTLPPMYLSRLGDVWRLMRTRQLINEDSVSDKPTIVLPQPGEANYGHWLIEMMPKLLPVLNFIHEGRLAVGLSATQASAPIIAETLSQIGIHQRNIVVLPDHPVRLSRVLYVSPVSKHAHPGYISPTSTSALAEYVSDVPTESSGRRIFVSRRDAALRHLLNEDEIYESISSAGYERICTGNLSFQEQIKTFGGAAQVIGVFGASLTNIVFCRPGTKVMNLSPGYVLDHFYWNIATLKHLSYWHLNGWTPDQVFAKTRYNSDFSVDQSEFLNFFEDFTSV